MAILQLCLHFATGSFHTKKLCSILYSIEVHFSQNKTKKLLSEPRISGLKGNMCTPSIARHIELFCYLLRLRHYKRKSVEVGIFQRMWVTLSANFRWKGPSPTNHCWCQKTRVIALTCGIKNSKVITIHQRHRQMDGRTDGHNVRGISATCVYTCRAKNHKHFSCLSCLFKE